MRFLLLAIFSLKHLFRKKAIFFTVLTIFDNLDYWNYWTFVNMKTFQTIDNHCDLTIKNKHCNVYQSQTGVHNPKAKVTEDDDDTLGS